MHNYKFPLYDKETMTPCGAVVAEVSEDEVSRLRKVMKDVKDGTDESRTAVEFTNIYYADHEAGGGSGTYRINYSSDYDCLMIPLIRDGRTIVFFFDPRENDGTPILLRKSLPARQKRSCSTGKQGMLDGQSLPVSEKVEKPGSNGWCGYPEL